MTKPSNISIATPTKVSQYNNVVFKVSKVVISTFTIFIAHFVFIVQCCNCFDEKVTSLEKYFYSNMESFFKQSWSSTFICLIIGNFEGKCKGNKIERKSKKKEKIEKSKKI